MNDLAYPDHFDCDCRSDVHDLCDTSTAFYVNGETQKYHMGHAVVDYPLSAMDFKNGIDIDQIREQPEGDEAMLQHLSPEIRNRIIDINILCLYHQYISLKSDRLLVIQLQHIQFCALVLRRLQ